MKIIMCIILLIILWVPSCYFIGVRNVDYVKKHAEYRYAEIGHEIVGYEGYQSSLFSGGDVWYITKKGNVVFNSYLSKWGDEIHLYYLNVLYGNDLNIKMRKSQK